MRRLYVVGAFGVIGTVVAAFLYVRSAVFGDLFKGLFSFTLVVWGGAFIKRAIDTSLDERERRNGLIKEFIEIFSQFYSVRKLYDSARQHPQVYGQTSEECAALRKELLRKSVELEGRYGALKILAINHFSLPADDLGTKKIDELMDNIHQAERNVRERKDVFKNTRALMRAQFDLLGELYDEWRHALEQDCGIGQSTRIASTRAYGAVDKKVWESYEALLSRLVTASVLPPIGGAAIRKLQTLFQRFAHPFAAMPAFRRRTGANTFTK